MNATVASIEVSSYLEAVRARLSDVPEAERCELLEDLEQHLLEVAAEEDGSLRARLGPPEAYAEELRASAGFDDTATGVGRLFDRARASRAVRAAEGLLADAAQWRGVRAVRAFLPELRPGWWVLRGYLAVAAPAAIPDYREGAAFPVPYVLGSRAVGLLAVGAGVWASVAFGRKSLGPGFRRRRFLVDIAIVVLALIAVARLWSPPSYGFDESALYQGAPSFLAHADGTPIANICPYAADGTLLHGVFLVDQDGRAIIDVATATADGAPITPSHPAIRNAYPLDVSRPDPLTGEPVPLACPAFVGPGAPQGQPSPGAAGPGVPSPIPGASAQPSAPSGN